MDELMKHLNNRFLDEVLAGNRIVINMSDIDEVCQDWNISVTGTQKATVLRRFRAECQDVQNRLERFKNEIRREKYE